MYLENNTPSPNCQFETQAMINGFSHPHEPSMLTVEIAELTNKRHDHVMRDAKVVLTELYGEDSPPKFGESYKAENGQIYPCYRLPKKEVLVLVSGYSITLRMKIITRLEKLEVQNRNSALSIPDFTNPAEAARAFADQWEQRALAEKQRDHAMATKAEISRRREATAMNTASRLSKENTRLRDQVGDSKTWKQARAIPWLKDFFNLDRTAYSQIGRRLTKESQALGIEPRTIEHSKWGTVKTYHSDVIEHFKHKLISDLNLMRKYRKY